MHMIIIQIIVGSYTFVGKNLRLSVTLDKGKINAC